MPEAHDNPEPTLRHIIGRIDRALRAELDQRLTALNLTTPAYTTLFVLRRVPNLSNAELARRTGVTPQAMNQIILPLLDRGLVARRAAKSHSRILETRLTAKGRRLIERCEREAGEIEGSMLVGFSAGERETFEHLLRACATNLRLGV